ncbi:MAG: hypothetical protein LBR35_01215 [Rickettsiales bacterium]|nr:hypothetical protein [Rickettsiales bacterium]
MKKKSNIGFGILSWKAHHTLIQTLETYKKADLTSFFDETIIWFNQRTKEDDAIAKKYGYKAFGDDRNLAFKAEENIAQSLTTEYVLIVQNDNQLAVYDKKEIQKQLETAKHLLEKGVCDIVRMRHRYMVGEGFSDARKYLNYHNISKSSKSLIKEQHKLSADDLKYNPFKFLKRLFRPFKAKRLIGRSVFIEDNAALLYPKYIQKIDDTFIVDSAYMNHSEQPFMVKRDFFLNTICKYINENPKKRGLNGFQVPEIILNCKWWKNKHFKIGVPVGLFTHGRFDGSFRKFHKSYDESYDNVKGARYGTTDKKTKRS